MAAEAASTATPPDIGTNGRGHIGLVVLGSIASGLILGLVLTLGVFGGGPEHVITGAALVALAVGMLTLFELARRRTDQPQSWALVPALGIGVVGLALLILGPSDRVLGRLGWVWPLLLVLIVVWCVRGAHRSLHNWSRRWLLYPAFAVLTLIALGGAYETVTEATTDNNPPSGGRTYGVAGRSLYLRCTGSGSRLSSCSMGSASGLRAGLGWNRMSHARLGSASSIAPAKVGVGKGQVARMRISFPPTCMAFLRQRMFRGHTFSPVTQSAVRMHSPSRWTIRRT